MANRFERRNRSRRPCDAFASARAASSRKLEAAKVAADSTQGARCRAPVFPSPATARSPLRHWQGCMPHCPYPSGFRPQAHDPALPRKPSGGARRPERLRDARQREACASDLRRGLWPHPLADGIQGAALRHHAWCLPSAGISSRLCSVCGWKHETLTLGEREWTCPECGTHHDRDLNAAINLQRLATITALPVASPSGNGGATSEGFLK